MIRLSEKMPRARKEHQCDLCYLMIPVGTVYHYNTMMDGGAPYVWKSHVECEAEAVRKCEYEWPCGMLIEYCYDEDLSDEWKDFYHKMKFGTEAIK
jgi:hypothetical protein